MTVLSTLLQRGGGGRENVAFPPAHSGVEWLYGEGAAE